MTKAESLEVKTLRLEIEAVQVDLRNTPERLREFGIFCEALGRSRQFKNLAADLADTPTELMVASVLAEIATGLQLGIDLQKRRIESDTVPPSRDEALTPTELHAGEMLVAKWSDDSPDKFPIAGLRNLIAEHSAVVPALVRGMRKKERAAQLVARLYEAGVIVGIGIGQQIASTRTSGPKPASDPNSNKKES